MNGINLRAFQFDFDLTWMSYFQNCVGQTYARYGGREDGGPESHLSKASLLQTMQRVLKLHAEDRVKPWSTYDPEPTETFTPEEIPPMKSMLAKRKISCIHCHDVKNATLKQLASEDNLTKYHVFGYPSPERLGLLLNSDDQTVVDQVVPDSLAAIAGIKKGDVVRSANDQRILTFADFTRVLELVSENGKIAVEIDRGGTTKNFELSVNPGWRKSPDPSWRASKGVVGPNSGFWANPLNANQLKQRGVSANELALKVVVVWGDWAKKAGVRNGDILIDLDGIKTKKTIRQLQTHLQLNRNFGDLVKLTVIRQGQRKELTMTLPSTGE